MIPWREKIIPDWDDPPQYDTWTQHRPGSLKRPARTVFFVQ